MSFINWDQMPMPALAQPSTTTTGESEPAHGQRTMEDDDLQRWLQPNSSLFDDEVYGWLEQMIDPQALTAPVPSAQREPPRISTNPTLSLSASLCLSYPSLPAHVRIQITPLWIALHNDREIPEASQLELYFSNGWRELVTRFPIVHLPTFDVNSACMSFLVGLIVCGAAHSESVADRQFAQLLSPVLRAIAVSVGGALCIANGTRRQV